MKLSLLLALFGALATVSARGLRGARALQQTDDDDDDDDAPPMLRDIDILNFALNLECLEADFYSWAAFGRGLSTELLGGGPASTGGAKANLTERYQVYAEELARNEIDHVKLLRSALGANAVQCPAMDLGPAFSAAAEAAVGAPLDPPYSPYYSDSWFLLGAFIFEDVGVTAYAGAAPLLRNKSNLGSAVSIALVEAYHGGMVRTLLNEIRNDTLTPYPLTVTEGVTAVSALRAAVGGGKDHSIVVNGTQTIVPADSDALAYARSVDEVLAIVYLGNSTAPGGFFPQGISTTAVAAAYLDDSDDSDGDGYNDTEDSDDDNDGIPDARDTDDGADDGSDDGDDGTDDADGPGDDADDGADGGPDGDADDGSDGRRFM